MGGAPLIPRRFDVVLVCLDPTVGHEMQKTRPCVVVSPDEINRALQTCIVAPLTTGRTWPWRPGTRLQGQPGCVAIDQLRCVDRARLVRVLGALEGEAREALQSALVSFFAP